MIWVSWREDHRWNRLSESVFRKPRIKTKDRFTPSINTDTSFAYKMLLPLMSVKLCFALTSDLLLCHLIYPVENILAYKPTRLSHLQNFFFLSWMFRFYFLNSFFLLATFLGMFFLFMYSKVGESQEIWGKRINEEHAGRPAEDLLLRALALMFYALIHWVTLRLVIVLFF